MGNQMVNFSYKRLFLGFIANLYLFGFAGENKMPKEQKRDKSDPKNGKLQFLCLFGRCSLVLTNVVLYLFLFAGENKMPKEQKREKSDPKNGKSNGKSQI